MRRAVVPLLAALVGVAPAAEADEPALESVNVFPGDIPGRGFYRIPGIVVTPKGALLAYCEARAPGSTDWGAIDVLARRSADGGKTWSEPRPFLYPGEFRRNPAAVAAGLAAASGVTHNNPVAIPDAKTGAIHFLFCVEYLRCYYCRSDDDGRTFSAPVDITPTFDRFAKEYPWRVLATGPGHGIQLKSGRLVVPVWLSRGTHGGAHQPSGTATIYSDDHGKTWHRGEIVSPEGGPLENSSEAAIAELSDGRVLMNLRHESPPRRRAVAVSPDGAGRWTKPEFDAGLFEPICMAGLLTVPGRGLVFTNPYPVDPAADPAAKPSRQRKNLVARLSLDDGKTWAYSRVIDPGAAAYSDLAADAEGTIYCLYEKGPIGVPGSSISLAKFTTDWISRGKRPRPGE